jgi:SNF2 family DNA or RNA helicase
MNDWNRDNLVELVYSDRRNVKKKLRDLIFDKPENLINTLHAYEITNSLHTRDLTIQRSLDSSIQILDHQIMAAKLVKNDLNGRVLLADEVGLGKTIEAGILLKEYFVTGLIRNALILTPPSLRTQWQEELKSKFGLDFIINRDDPRFRDFDKHNMLISSLASAAIPKNARKLKDIEWDLVIVDEAHRLKNASTKAHQFVKELPKKFVFLLSATPIQNSLQELYNMIEIIRPGILGSWNNFASTYTMDKKARQVNPQMKYELQNLLKQVVIRTTRNEVRNYLQFTDRIPKTHLLDATPNEIALYNGATDFVRELWEKEKEAKNFILPLMTLQRQISSSSAATKVAIQKKITQFPQSKPELEEVLALADQIPIDSKMICLEEILKKNPDSKHLIFTEFTDTQDYIFDKLEDDKISTVKFNGSMTTSERDTAVSKFKRDVQVLVSTEAGGEGQNFQFCSNVVNYDLPWNPMRVEQRVGRVHRIGQDEDVNIHNLAIIGTIEEYILKLLFDKINLFKMTIGDLDLLFEDEGFKKLPSEVFESYMSATSNRELKNKFSALGEKWAHKKEEIHDTVLEFDDAVFANFKLSSLED